MPDTALLTPLGRKMLARWPPFLQVVPEFIAIAHCYAKLIEEVDAMVEQVRSQGSVRLADIMLREWEAILGAPIETPGDSIEQRRLAALAYMRRLRGVPYGITWKQKVELLVGPGFTVLEHDPNDVGTPPAHVVRITITFAPGSDRYIQLVDTLREVTPAHLEIQLIYDSDGFLLDLSLLDLEQL